MDQVVIISILVRVYLQFESGSQLLVSILLDVHVIELKTISLLQRIFETAKIIKNEINHDHVTIEC